VTVTSIDLRFRIRESFADENEIQLWKSDLGPEKVLAEPQPASPASLGADVQAMLSKCLADHREDQKLRASAFAALKSNRLDNLQFVGNALRQIFANRLKIHALVRECAGLVKPVQSVEALDQASADYRNWTDSLLRGWPWVSHDQLRKSFASFERGDVCSTLDFLDELRDSANAGSN